MEEKEGRGRRGSGGRVKEWRKKRFGRGRERHVKGTAA
jgi:hypothetical protein